MKIKTALPFSRSILAFGLALALLALPGGWSAGPNPLRGADEPGGEPPSPPPAHGGAGGDVEITPRTGERPTPLEVGEIRLPVVLQALSNATGLRVLWTSDGPLGDEMVRIARAIPSPDRPAIAKALAACGYSLREGTNRGKDVLLVGKELRPVRKPGTITLPGKTGGAPPKKAARAAPAAAGEGMVRVYRQGEGPGESYLVMFETRSKAEADDAVSLLRSFLARKEKGAEEGEAETEGARKKTPPERK